MDSPDYWEPSPYYTPDPDSLYTPIPDTWENRYISPTYLDYLQTRLTDDGEDDNPVWSPNGQYIAFTSNRDGRWGLWLMRPDGTSKTRLIPTVVGNQVVTWSPDSQRIAFVTNVFGQPDICVINVFVSVSNAIYGGALTRLTFTPEAESSPVWSP